MCFAVTYATEPALPHGAAKSESIECVSTSSSADHFATSSLHGNVVIWNIARQLKVCIAAVYLLSQSCNQE